MSDVKHTAEPWRVVGYSEIVSKIGDAEYAGVASVLHNENDARRIVACVNACAGIDTAHLELATVSGVTIADELARIKNQRDQLLKALENIVEKFGCRGDGWPDHRFDKARAAIAAVKGEK